MSAVTSPAAVVGRPTSVVALRLAGYLAGAALIVPATTNVGGLTQLGQWWNQPITVQKFVMWALLWEFLGLPMVRPGRPAPIGGALYWLQTETLRLPPGHRLARVARGTRRTPIDVGLYLLVACTAVVLLCSGITQGEPYDTLPKPALAVLLAALMALGFRDRTAFLAARPEVYAVMLAVCFGPASSLAFGLGLCLMAIAAAELVAGVLGRSTLAPETVVLLGYVLAVVAHSGLNPGSAGGWALLPVAALALAGPVLHRVAATLWLFRTGGAEQRFASAVVTPGTDWTARAPAAPPAVTRAFADLLPRAVSDPEAYAARDGALVARVALGGAAPSGRALLATVQHECDFPPGEVRVIEVAPARFRSRVRRYRVLDAATGVLETGTVRTARRGRTQPRPTAPVCPPRPPPTHTLPAVRACPHARNKRLG